MFTNTPTTIFINSTEISIYVQFKLTFTIATSKASFTLKTLFEAFKSFWYMTLDYT